MFFFPLGLHSAEGVNVSFARDGCVRISNETWDGAVPQTEYILDDALRHMSLLGAHLPSR